MRLMTWNVNKFNGNRWSPKDHNWMDNQDIVRKENAKKIFEVIAQNIVADNDIAILQEFPYHEENWKREFENQYKNHSIISWYHEDQDKDYCVNTEYGVTVAVVKKNGNSKWHLHRLSNHSLNEKKTVDFSNRYIELFNDDIGINLMGVHPRDAEELEIWMKQKCKNNNIFHIIMGDFNAGNYVKEDCNEEFIDNRRKFIDLSEGYIDVCNGMGTTNYNPPTQIDHILVQNSQKFWGRIKTRDVVYTKEYSDHFLLVTEIEI